MDISFPAQGAGHLGDDCFVLADQEGQDYMQKVLAKKYDFGCDGMIGPDSDESDDAHLTILNRAVSLEKLLAMKQILDMQR